MGSQALVYLLGQGQAYHRRLAEHPQAIVLHRTEISAIMALISVL